MSKKIYVDGGILVNTLYFTCKDAGCKFKTQPEDTELIIPNDTVNGEPCLIIDDDNPQSIFNEYYAKTFLTFVYGASGYIKNNYLDCYNEYTDAINALIKLTDSVSNLDKNIESTLYKMIYLNVISALDALICSILLVRLVRNETAFNVYADKMFSKSLKQKLEKLKLENREGKREQLIIENILKTSFTSNDTIKDAMKIAGFDISNVDLGSMSEHFKNRHILVHRNGKRKDGEYMIISDKELKDVSDHTNKLAYQIMYAVADVVKKENENKPKDTRPIPSIITAENGLKLSDIARVLYQ